jgi:hypothetical protein
VALAALARLPGLCLFCGMQNSCPLGVKPSSDVILRVVIFQQ